MKTILAKLKDPMVPGKIGFVFTPGPLTGVCAGTGVELTYQADRLYQVSEVATDFQAAIKAGWFARTVAVAAPIDKVDTDIDVLINQPYATPAVKPKTVAKPPKCPKCNGPRRGRGYTHTATCENNSQKV